MANVDRAELEMTIRREELANQRRQRAFDRQLVQQRFAMEQAQHFWRLGVTSFSVMFGFIPILLIVGRDTIDWPRLMRLAAMLFVAWFVAAFLPTMAIVHYFLRQHSRLGMWHESDGLSGPSKTLPYLQFSLIWIVPLSLAFAFAVALALRAAPLSGITSFETNETDSPHQLPKCDLADTQIICDRLTEIRDKLNEPSSPPHHVLDINVNTPHALSPDDKDSTPGPTPNGSGVNPGAIAANAIRTILSVAGTLTDLVADGAESSLSWATSLASLPPKAAQSLTEGFAHKSGEMIAERIFGREPAKPTSSTPDAAKPPTNRTNIGLQTNIYLALNDHKPESPPGRHPQVKHEENPTDPQPDTATEPALKRSELLNHCPTNLRMKRLRRHG